MTHELTKKIFRGSLPLALFAALLLATPSANAQDNTQTRSGGAESASNRAPVTASSGNVAPVVTPVFTNYRGVIIGMSADEARRTLDHLRDRGERQDFFVFSDDESAQVYYDSDRKVRAIAVTFIGARNGAPDARAVLGEDVTANADGSMHRLVRYPVVGYWVSYSRSAGDSPIISVTMQRMR